LIDGAHCSHIEAHLEVRYTSAVLEDVIRSLVVLRWSLGVDTEKGMASCEYCAAYMGG